MIQADERIRDIFNKLLPSYVYYKTRVVAGKVERLLNLTGKSVERLM
jgi:hypothetical protein